MRARILWRSRLGVMGLLSVSTCLTTISAKRDDARMVRFRRWLSQLAPLLSFALASTPAMAEVVHAYRADLPVKVVNDPAALRWCGHGRLRARLGLPPSLTKRPTNSACGSRGSGLATILHFRSDLHDLSAFSAELAAIAANDRHDCRLDPAHQSRALTARPFGDDRGIAGRDAASTNGAKRRRTHSSKFSFACFLPVNAQPFSAAKSLNRAVTALAAGCQILSVGYPLYAPFDSLIYRDAETLASDSRRGKSACLVRASCRTGRRAVAMGIGGCRSKGSGDISGGRCRASRVPSVKSRSCMAPRRAAWCISSPTSTAISRCRRPTHRRWPGSTRWRVAVAPLRFDLLVGKKLAKRAKLASGAPRSEDGAIRKASMRVHGR